MNIYTGIGSRETPPEILKKMTEYARELSSLGYVLRSGGAPGADSAFELGAIHKQIFLPWDGFNGRKKDDINYFVAPYRDDFVEKYHPKPSALSQAGRKLMSRNANQVLGYNFKNPTEFILCWTKDGKASGGTGFAIRMATDLGITVYNLKTVDFQETLTMMKLTR